MDLLNFLEKFKIVQSMKLLRQIITTAVTLNLLVGCGYEFPKGDKYPDLSEFQNLKNTVFEMDTIFCGTDKFLYDSDYLYAINDKEELCVLDKNFRLKQIIGDSVSNFAVGTDKTVYMQHQNFISKIKYPSKTKVRLPYIALDIPDESYIAQKYHLSADSLGYYDSEKMDSLIKIEIDKQMGIVRKVYNLGWGWNYLCITSQGEVVSDTQYSEFCTTPIDSFPSAKEMKKTEKHLRKFDSSVLGNKSGGNHFVFWFQPYSYDYYTLKIGRDSIRFKVNDGEHSISELKDPFGNSVLVKFDNVLYSIKRRK